MNFVYLKVLFDDPKNKLSIFLSFHFYITNQKKNNFFFFENILEFQQQILPLKCINHVGVLISNPSAVQFSYKCELGNFLQRHQNSQLLLIHSIIWSVFSGIVLNQRINFTVLMLKSSFNYLRSTMASEK